MAKVRCRRFYDFLQLRSFGYASLKPKWHLVIGAPSNSPKAGSDPLLALA